MSAFGQSDQEAIIAAVLDYVEGFYNVTPDRVARSLHPDVAKSGFYRLPGETAITYGPMTFEQLVEGATRYNHARTLPPDAPKEIIVYDILDYIATVKLVGAWGVDYMHLGKQPDGAWKIINVLWQIPPQQVR